jgi:hypothetical protein
MRIDWLKKILSTARAEGMDILGFDDLQFSAAPPMRTGR